MLETKTFIRKSFLVKAVQVTRENIAEVAEWCKGTIRNNPKGTYIDVDVKHPMTPKQTKAYIGDHVLLSDKGFKIYTDGAFQTHFDEGEAETTTEDLNTAFQHVQQNIFDTPVELRSVVTEGPEVNPKDAISGKR